MIALKTSRAGKMNNCIDYNFTGTTKFKSLILGISNNKGQGFGWKTGCDVGFIPSSEPLLKTITEK